jgi:sorbitol-specific phosphotransferase system component IIBC
VGNYTLGFNTPISRIKQSIKSKERKMGAYKSVVVSAGKGGWGGPLTITPTDDRPYIYSVTGGGIHPVAARIAELTGGTPFDGFKSSVPFDKIAVAVIDCGGTARVGVYPMKKVLTVDIHATSPAGPLAMFITPELFVSGVKPDNIVEK